MGGAPTVNGADFLDICSRHRWSEDVAFYLLDQILAGYAAGAAAEKP